MLGFLLRIVFCLFLIMCKNFLSFENFEIGHLHDGVNLLLRSVFFSFFLSYLNFVIPVRFEWQKPLLAQESKTLTDSGHSSNMMSSCKWPVTRICLENHASVTEWQKVVFLIQMLPTFSGRFNRSFEIYGWKFSGYIILICSFSLC